MSYKYMKKTNTNKGEKIMAIHIKDVDEAVEIIRDTKKALKKLETIIPVSELHRLSLRVDNFLSNLDEWDCIETVK